MDLRRRVVLRRATAPTALAIVVILAGALDASAQTDPYQPGTTGYDVSYPQCGSASPTGSFAIVGVNGGRPFSYNQCLAAEYLAAPTTPAPSLYINAAYSGAYRKNVTSNCSAMSGQIAGTRTQEQAWAIGCSEAETSLGYAGRQGATVDAMWWIDVETANSWSSSNLVLNRYAVQGAVSRLDQTGLPVGVYSSASMWHAITGGNYTPTGIEADWETAGGQCGSVGFTSSPVWLLQSVAGGADSDLAC